MAERPKAHVLKTCLGHTNVGSNPTPSARQLQVHKLKVYSWTNLQLVNLELSNRILGRCQSGRMGPPAKRLPGRNPRSQVRILSSPPHENAFHKERVLFSVARPHREGDIRILSSPPHKTRSMGTRFYFKHKGHQVHKGFISGSVSFPNGTFGIRGVRRNGARLGGTCEWSAA
jgi:hypothetical protein